MPSPESAPTGGEPIDEKAPVTAPETTETGTDDSEVVGEKDRKTFEERGEKTFEAKEVSEAKEKSTRAELEKEREKLKEEIRMLEMRREILLKYGAKSTAETIDDDKKPEGDSSEPETKSAPAEGVVAGAAAGAATGEKPAETESKAPEEEPASPEAIEETKKRAKKNGGGRRFAGGILALVAAAGIIGGALTFANRDKNDSDRLGNGSPAIVTTAETEKNLGIYDGYGERGMYLSEHKTSAVAFADAGEVSEVCNDDEVDMILYTAHNQVESFADYLANIPADLQPDGFKGLSILETEAKLESLSPEEFTALEGTFASIMNEALTRRVTLNGRYDNAYMRVKNPGQAIVHENMELVRCTTNENNLEVTQFYWTDASGREIGSMTVKMTPVRDEKGVIESFKGCEQVVNPEGSSIYTGMPDIPEPEPTPTPTPPSPEPEPEPEPELTPKNPAEEIAHAGPDVTPLELNEDVTPATTLEQDQANFAAIEQQRQQDAARQAEAERVAAQQAEAERQAAQQAEARRQAEAEAAAQRSAQEAAAEAQRQAEANRAAEAAAAQAAQEQAARAQAEQQAAEEAAAREAAQQQANVAAEQAAPEAASHADDSAAERANLFANGEF